MSRGAAVLFATALLAAGCSAASDDTDPSGQPTPRSSSAQAGTPTAGTTRQPTLSSSVVVRFAGAPPLRVEVAHTPAQRQLGLMGRTEVPEGTGMLFLFPSASRSGFWMKNTLVPLSIAYVNSDRVVSVAEMTPCRRDPCPSYPAGGPYTFAVEARANFFTEHRVGRGARVEIDGTLPSAR
jgi:uncharacterized membrane protein (UPF0127 family)